MRGEAPSSLYRSGKTFHLDQKGRLGKDCRLYQIFQALSEVVWSEYDVWGTDQDPVATLHTRASINGRLLAQTAVDIDSATIVAPAP